MIFMAFRGMADYQSHTWIKNSCKQHECVTYSYKNMSLYVNYTLIAK